MSTFIVSPCLLFEQYTRIAKPRRYICKPSINKLIYKLQKEHRTYKQIKRTEYFREHSL